MNMGDINNFERDFSSYSIPDSNAAPKTDPNISQDPSPESASSPEAQKPPPSPEEISVKAALDVLAKIEADMKNVSTLAGINFDLSLSSDAADLTGLGRNFLTGVQSLGAIPELSGSILFPTSLNAVSGVGTGTTSVIHLAALLPKANEWKRLQSLLAEKKTEMHTLSSHNPPGTQVQKRQAELHREIEEIEGTLTDLARDTALGLLSSSVAFSSDIANTSSYVAALLAPASQAGEVLGAVGGSLTVAGSFLGAATSSYTIYQTSSEFESIMAETDRLVAKLAKETDPAIKMVIGLRLKVLEQSYNDTLIQMVKSTLSLGCCVAGGAATGISVGLAVAGITTGAAVTAATTGGVSVAVLGVGLLIASLGYAGYKNRKLIEIRLNQASKASQEIVGQQVLKKNKSALKKAEAESLKIQEKIEKIKINMENSEKKLQEEIEKNHSMINVLVSAKSDPRNDTPLLQQKLKYSIDAQFKNTGALYEKIDSIKINSMKDIELQLKNLNRVNKYISENFIKLSILKSEISSNQKQKMLLEIKAKIHKVSQKFPNMTPEGLENVSVSLFETLHQSKSSRTAVEEFLAKEGYSVADFEGNSIGAIFSYLTRTPQKEVPP